MERTDLVKLQPAKFVSVKDLSPGTHGHNLFVKVVSCNVVLEHVRPDGTKVKVAEAVLGDNTGSVVFTARNEQIGFVEVPGRTVVIRNAKIDMFKGYMRLAVDKWGKVEFAAEPATFEVNTAHNLSQIEYELVTVPETVAEA
eukprot:TRINITY_DN22601_c0_g1_i1.p1 TRINITY_DN22601_c0_g1~~TRINITY_DN22601_c0_g1_i1.p1  ORF type:complete len:142 (-),score=0.96 TRINITY_DN22601_c0_g1_i1:179-604(-)